MKIPSYLALHSRHQLAEPVLVAIASDFLILSPRCPRNLEIRRFKSKPLLLIFTTSVVIHPTSCSAPLHYAVTLIHTSQQRPNSYCCCSLCVSLPAGRLGAWTGSCVLRNASPDEFPQLAGCLQLQPLLDVGLLHWHPSTEELILDHWSDRVVLAPLSMACPSPILSAP